LSRDAQQMQSLKRSLAVYRMVFGRRSRMTCWRFCWRG
jgi:hypothetical protein